jgi:hypothetical protein
MSEVVHDLLERVEAGPLHDPFRGQHGAERESTTRPRPVLEQDLVAAGVETHRVLAHDPARAHRGDVEPVVRDRAFERGDRLLARSRRGFEDLRQGPGRARRRVFLLAVVLLQDVGIVVGKRAKSCAASRTTL